MKRSLSRRYPVCTFFHALIIFNSYGKCNFNKIPLFPENCTTEITTAGYFEKFADVKKSAIHAAEYSKEDSGEILPSTPCAWNWKLVPELTIHKQFYSNLNVKGIRAINHENQFQWRRNLYENNNNFLYERIGHNIIITPLN